GTFPSGLYLSGYLTHHSFRSSGSFIRSIKYLNSRVLLKKRTYSNVLRNWPRLDQGRILVLFQMITSWRIHPKRFKRAAKSNGRSRNSDFSLKVSATTQRDPVSF